MYRLICVSLPFALAACGGAAARQYDSSEPANCLAIFSITANGAAESGNSRLAREMTERMVRLAQQHGGSAWIEKVTPRSIEFGKTLERDKDQQALMNLLEECRGRHPGR